MSNLITLRTLSASLYMNVELPNCVTKNYCLSIINIRSSQSILTLSCALSRLHRLAGQTMHIAAEPNSDRPIVPRC